MMLGLKVGLSPTKEPSKLRSTSLNMASSLQLAAKYSAAHNSMSLKLHKIIATAIVGFTVILGFEALAYILNLNQINIYLHLSFWLWIFLGLIMAFWYDVHFKNRGSLQRARERHADVGHKLVRAWKIWSTAVWERIEHFRRWRYFKLWVNYLLLPGLTFWGTVTMLYLNIGPWNWHIQQTFIALSSIALIVNYWFLKEVFMRGREAVDYDIFISLTMVKIYTAAVLFGAGLGILRSLCRPDLYAALVFALTFLLVYQALFQHRLINAKNLGFALGISALMAGAGYLVYQSWGYNYFTAAILMAAIYNLLWGMFHYHLDRALTRRAFVEILAISLLVALMVLQVTNFKAKILGTCI